MKYSVPSHLRWSLVIAGLLALPLHAAPLTWSGSSGGTWDTTTLGGWTVVVPNAPASATISYTLPSGQPEVFARLKITQIP